MQTLDVAIGLVFVYLILSLVCTAANELLSQWFNSRATTLKQGIDALLRNVTLHTDLKAVQRAANDAEAARNAFELSLQQNVKVAYDAFEIARRALHDSVLIADDVCARRAVSVASADVSSLSTALAAAQSVRATAEAQCASAAALLNAWQSGATVKLLRLREDAEHARTHCTLDAFYDHPLVSGLSQLPWRLWPWEKKVRLPSYIPTRTFTAALIDTIAPASSGAASPLLEVRRALPSLPEHLRRPLLLALNDAGGDLALFRQNVDRWFDSAMERVSGLYKRKTKVTVLLLAIAVTLFTNADTLHIVQALSSNRALREALVAQAEMTVRASNPVEPTAAKTIADIQALGIPIGYTISDSVARDVARAKWIGSPSRLILYAQLYIPQILSGLVGLLLTALALSLGAPFWFDMLNKIVNVRAVGRTPAENAKVAASTPS